MDWFSKTAAKFTLKQFFGRLLRNLSAAKLARRAEISPALHTLDKAIRVAVMETFTHLSATEIPEIETDTNFLSIREDLKIDLPESLTKDIDSFEDILIELVNDINFTVNHLDPKARSAAVTRRRKKWILLNDAKEELHKKIKKEL